MAIRMRYGFESQFDPSKMVVGEWAVSTDTRYVRMCFSPGIVLRMATYDAFEADMAKIKAILAECRDIQTAITRIQSEVNAKAVLCAEYAESAKKSADEAAESANKAKMYAENASAVTGVQIATEDIAGLVKGGDNHIAEDGTLTLTARTNSGVLKHSHAGGIRLHSITAVEDRQDGVPMPGEWAVLSNNQLKVKLSEETTDGITYSDNGNGGVEVFGDATADVRIVVGEVTLKAGTYYAYNDYTNRSEVGVDGSYYVGIYEADNLVDAIAVLDDTGEVAFTLTEDKTVTYVLDILSENYISAVFYPMIATTSGATWDVYAEGYTEGYPQPIEATVMKNLLENTAVSQTIKGVTFTVNADKSVTLNGEATEAIPFYLGDAFALEAGSYTLSGGCGDYSSSTGYFLFIEDMGQYSDSTHNPTFTLKEKASGRARITVRAGAVLNNVTFYPMLRKAEILDDTYVPYGCMRVVGRNDAQLFDKTAVTSGYSVSNANGVVYADSNSFAADYIFIGGMDSIVTNIKSISTGYVWGAFYDTKKVFVSGFSTKESVLAIPEGAAYVRIGGLITYLDTGIIASGTELPDYVEYQAPQSTILSKQFSDFHNIGGITDYLTSRAEVRRISTKVFDGSGSWAASSVLSGRYMIGLSNAKPTHAPLCTQARGYNSQTNPEYDKVGGMCSVNSAGTFYINTDFATVDEWKAYLTEHPMTVVYELANEVVTSLPTADQIALHSLKSYDGVTQIYTDTTPPMVIDCDFGTSKVGAEMYETWNMGKRTEIENAELRNMITNLATALVAGSEV